MKKSLVLPGLLGLLAIASCQPKPSPEKGNPEPAAEEASDGVPKPESFVGLKLEEAEARAKEADLPFRVVRKDGEDFPVTRDYRPERLNFTVENGVVTKVTNG